MAVATAPLRDPTFDMQEYMINLAMVAARAMIDENDPEYKISRWDRTYYSWKIPMATAFNPPESGRIIYNCKCMAWYDVKYTSPDAPCPKDSAVEIWWKRFVMGYINYIYSEMDAVADHREKVAKASARDAKAVKASVKKIKRHAYHMPVIDDVDDLDSHAHKDDFDD
jgi:hypothetical protein